MAKLECVGIMRKERPSEGGGGRLLGKVASFFFLGRLEDWGLIFSRDLPALSLLPSIPVSPSPVVYPQLISEFLPCAGYYFRRFSGAQKKDNLVFKNSCPLNDQNGLVPWTAP